MHSVPLGKSEFCAQRAGWTSDHCHWIVKQRRLTAKRLFRVCCFLWFLIFVFLPLYFFVRCGVFEDCGRSVRACLQRVRTTTLSPSTRHLTRRTGKGIFGDYGLPGWMRAWNTGDRSRNSVLFRIERHPEHHLKAGPSRSLSALIQALNV